MDRRHHALVLAMTLLTLCGGPVRAADTGRSFPSPDAAVTALGEAANAADRDALRALFGLATDELVAADRVQAANDLAEFTAAFNTSHQLVSVSETRTILEVGPGRWPFPIPITRRNGQWAFDTAAGKEELLNRRIGRNELATLRAVRGYVDAQREYAGRDRDGDGVLEYAQRFASTPGNMDGLYWSPDLNGEISPLGPLVAQASAAGYQRPGGSDEGSPAPFHGYYFKILTRQGRHAPGGAYRYVINGNMIGGFALVAWPAQYGESGIMTFIVNQQGRVYQKDLGPQTASRAAAISRYDPDSSWQLSPD